MKKRDLTALFLEVSLENRRLKREGSERDRVQREALADERQRRAHAEHRESILSSEIETTRGLPEVAKAQKCLTIFDNAEQLRKALRSNAPDSIPTHEVIALLDALLDDE